MPRDGADEVADQRAMAAELERQFTGYKQRLAERNGSAHVDNDDDDESGGVGEPEPGDGDSGDDVMRGRMYEAYVRRRDERLRQGWRARMERKEAEVKAFWAQLEFTGRAGGGNGDRASTGDDEEGKTDERHDDDDKKRSSDGAALGPRRISGKKHARAMSFSPSTNAVSNSPDIIRRRRALSQEPPPSEPQAGAGDATKESQARPASGAATTKTAAGRPKISSRRKDSVKGLHGSAKQTAGPKKLPRSLPRREGDSSGGRLLDLGGSEVVLPSTDAPAPVPSCSYGQDVHGETPRNSPPRTSAGGGTDAANVQTASPDSDRSEVVDAVPDGEPEAENVDVEKRGDEEVDASSPAKLIGNPNGEFTNDPDIESSYVYINKPIVEEQATSLPETMAAPVAVPPEFRVKTKEDNIERTTPPADATAKETIVTTDAEEPPARASSGDSSSSGSSRLGRSPASSAAPSCISRDQSIERVLEADAALLWKMREKVAETPPSSAAPSCCSRDQSIERALEADAALLRKKRAERSTLKTSTPGSAGSRVSGLARSPKETPKGFKRFLSFGKKNRAREVTVIDCKSPSVAEDDSGGWQSAGSIKPRMGYSDAASDDTDHGHTSSPRVCSLQSRVAASPAKSELVEIVPVVRSPKAHRSFFSFRALNCGLG